MEEYNYAHTLNPTEITVALLYNRNRGVKEIAAHLGTSERTVKRHIRDIYDKLCITNKTDLVKYLEK